MAVIRVLLAIDLIDLEEQLKESGKRPNLKSLCEFLVDPFEERYGIDCWVFTNTPPETKAEFFQRYPQLKLQDFRVIDREDYPSTYVKQKINLEFAFLLVDFLSKGRIDLVVLVSSDPALIPLYEKVRDRGVRLEVAGLGSHISHELKAAARGFTDLLPWVETCEVE